MVTNFAVVAIGASLGGVAAIRTLVAGLDPGVPAAYFVVIHVGSFQSRFPSVLNSAGPIPAEWAPHGGPIEPGRIFVAPPDHHLLLGPTEMSLSRGPRENWSRPAIDPLFRSAARAFGRRAIGVVLTGKLSDGTAGLYEIHRQGGVAVIQDPGEAECPDMPASALQHVPVDHWLPLEQIPPLLRDLSRRIAGLTEEQPSRAGAMR